MAATPNGIDVGDIHEDPRGRQRTLPMEVLCLGMGRNGTESLCTALTMLGIPTYHGWHTIANPRHSILWYEAALSKFSNKGRLWTRQDFDQMLGRSGACTDNPAAMFAIELIEAYPEAKVILNRRPIEQWWASWQRNILPIKEDWWFWFLAHFDWECFHTFILWHRMQNLYFRRDSRRNGPQIYKEHCALVRGAVVEPERLLEWQPEDGWGPICEFLGRSVPVDGDGRELEFPNKNQTEAFQRTVQWYFAPRLRRARRNLGLGIAGLVWICGLIWRRGGLGGRLSMVSEVWAWFEG